MSTSAVQVIPTTTSGGGVFMPIMSVELMLQRHKQMQEIISKLLQPGSDYDEFGGDKDKRKVLLKPGAEKLAMFFGLEPMLETVRVIEQWDGDEPFFFYHFRFTMSRGGVPVGIGEGSANTKETKYRYRWVPEEMVPAYYKDRAVKRGGTRKVFAPDFVLDKRETTGNFAKPESFYVAFEEAIANGTARRCKQEFGKSKKLSDGYEIELNQVEYRIPNPDICDLVNTVLKMATKRAFVAAVLMAVGLSDHFTQDLGDDELDVPPPVEPPPAERPMPVDQFVRGASQGEASRPVTLPKAWLSINQVIQSLRLERFEEWRRDVQERFNIAQFGKAPVEIQQAVIADLHEWILENHPDAVAQINEQVPELVKVPVVDREEEGVPW